MDELKTCHSVFWEELRIKIYRCNKITIYSLNRIKDKSWDSY